MVKYVLMTEKKQWKDSYSAQHGLMTIGIS